MRKCGKELQTRQKTVLPPPVLDPIIEGNWRAKVAVHQTIIQAKVDSYAKLLTTIEAAVAASPGDLNLAEKQIESQRRRARRSRNCWRIQPSSR